MFSIRRPTMLPAGLTTGTLLNPSQALNRYDGQAHNPPFNGQSMRQRELIRDFHEFPQKCEFGFRRVRFRKTAELLRKRCTALDKTAVLTDQSRFEDCVLDLLIV